jgi:protoporphyrinogen oxidase
MRVAVVGAGVAGLTTAYRLTEAGHQCDVWERWPGLGGMAATIDVGGHLLERYYHHLFTSDVVIARLWSELGMDDEVQWLDSSMACFTDGRLYPFTTPGDLLRFGALPPLSRARMGAVVVALQRFSNDPARFEGVTAKEWVTRWMGRAVWESFWGPMLRGKFGERADEIAMVWLWSKWMLRRQVQGEEARGEKLGYPRGSWETLLAALARKIESGGGRVLIDRPAAELGLAADGRFRLVPAEPGSFRTGLDPRGFRRDEESAATYDAAVVTVGGDLFAQLCTPELREQLGEDYLRRCETIESRGALCLLLELDRRFSPFYWTNVIDERCGFIGVIEHTNFAPLDWYDGRRFVYVANYLANDDPLMSLTMDELIAAYDDGLRLIQPDWSRDWIRQAWMFREPHGQPVITLGYRERLPALATPVPRLVLANIQQVYPEDRGTNYAVRLGDDAAATLLAQLGQSTSERALSEPRISETEPTTSASA